jgi:hypothetical protein
MIIINNEELMATSTSCHAAYTPRARVIPPEKINGVYLRLAEELIDTRLDAPVTKERVRYLAESIQKIDEDWS